MKLINLVAICCLSSWSLYGAGAPQSSFAAMQNKMLSQVEQEVVSLAEAMPAEKYTFAPTQGEFTGVRTFGLQMSHIAAVLNEFAGSMLSEGPVDIGKDENGPEGLREKDAVVKYLKDSFAHAHKAFGTLTPQSMTDELQLSWGKRLRGEVAGMCISHSFDHYGQSVVYARMNGIIPPASRRN